MKSRIIQINENNTENQLMDEVVTLLKKGGVIGYPTETVYGLGGDAFNECVIERLTKLKGRKKQNPFLLLVTKKEDVYALVQNVSQKAKVLMSRFWPGPLTLVFCGSSGLPKVVRPIRFVVYC
jgi:L-threonylcarbamoyladenylate synthase